MAHISSRTEPFEFCQPRSLAICVARAIGVNSVPFAATIAATAMAAASTGSRTLAQAIGTC